MSDTSASAGTPTVQAAPEDPAGPRTLTLTVDELDEIVAKAVARVAPHRAAAPAAAPVRHLGEDEVPNPGDFVSFNGRAGVVLSRYSRDCQDNKGNSWIQWHCRVGIFREAPVVDAEHLERL